MKQVFVNDVKDTNIPVEVWRYYLLTNSPEVLGTLFTWPDLHAKLNSELLNNLGNFINRVLSFMARPAGWYAFIILLFKCLLISCYKSSKTTFISTMTIYLGSWN